MLYLKQFTQFLLINVLIFFFFFCILHVNLLILAKKLPKNVNKSAVFACNELDLNEIQVYGFDYDYTLACYKKSLHYLLYNLARDRLVEKYKVNETFSHFRRFFLLILLFFTFFAFSLKFFEFNFMKFFFFLFSILNMSTAVSRGNKKFRVHARFCNSWITL